MNNMKAKFKNVVSGYKSQYKITDLLIKQDERILFWGAIEGFYENESMQNNRKFIESQLVKSIHVHNRCKLYIEIAGIEKEE